MIGALWMILGCTGVSPVDSVPVVDPGAAVDHCAVEDPSSGEPVGEASCSGGVCEVPAGPFVMGAANPLFQNQCPPRVVQLSAFAIDETEVTRGQYATCVSTGTCEALPYCESRSGDISDHEQLPVVCLTHTQAENFCSWVDGRLPTEAEWEKAARGEQGAVWAWGSHPPSCLIANFRYSSGYCVDGVVEVGSYDANNNELITVKSTRSAYGLLDTVGNAWEWVADAYDAPRYRDAPDVDPQGPEECAMTVGGKRGACSYHVIRGGSYNSVQDTTRSTTRSLARVGVFDVNIGMRCAYDR